MNIIARIAGRNLKSFAHSRMPTNLRTVITVTVKELKEKYPFVTHLLRENL